MRFLPDAVHLKAPRNTRSCALIWRPSRFPPNGAPHAWDRRFPRRSCARWGRTLQNVFRTRRSSARCSAWRLLPVWRRLRPSHQSPTSGHALAPDDVAAIQANLIPYLGPVTPRLLAKAASRTTSRGLLIQELAAHIPDLRDRENFLKACRPRFGESNTTVLPSGTTAPVETPQQVHWDSEYVAKVKEALTNYIGPIAGLLVDRTCKKVATRAQLYEALMAHIPSEKDKAKFLQSVPR